MLDSCLWSEQSTKDVKNFQKDFLLFLHYAADLITVSKKKDASDTLLILDIFSEWYIILIALN